eukprot:m.29026 g.29026  ORF g.29026 m.29026 type:complete len:498 (+) comp11914_c0_seq1:64-1557(+)
MAIPTLHSAYSSRRFDAERAIAQRRQQEEHRRGAWQQTSRYFKQEDARARKVNEWNSLKSFEKSLRTYRRENEADDRQAALSRRRQALTHLLQTENIQYEQELREHVPDTFKHDGMKARLAALKAQREKERKEMAEEMLHEAWKQQDPDLRAIKSKRLQHHFETERDKQAEAARVHREQAVAAARVERLELEAKAAAARRQEAEVEVRKREQAKRLQSELQQQLQALEAREREAELLRKEHDELLLEQAQLYQEEERRKAEQVQQQQIRYARTLRSQHKAALARQSQQVQEELQQDLDMLQQLAEAADGDKELEAARRQRAQDDVAWMKQETQRLLQLERQREQEIDELYYDEAQRMWAKQEAVWAREKEAREKLMRQVLAERQAQIEDKLYRVRDQQEGLIEEREALLASIEASERAEARAAQVEALELERMKQAWQAQLADRQAQEKAQEEEQLQIQLLQEQDEATRRGRLETETRRLASVYTPPKHGRRRIVWG